MVLERLLLQTLVIITVTSRLRAGWYTNVGSLGDYSPMGDRYSEYKLTADWLSYRTEGIFSARTAEYKFQGWGDSKRIVEYLAHDVPLGITMSHWNGSPDRMMGLAPVGSMLMYFHLATVRRLPSGRFLLLEHGKSCTRTVFELDSIRSKVIYKKILSDHSCRGYTPMPPMLLLSTSGVIGDYKETTREWMTFNPWQPLGFVSREYSYGWTDTCFRLVQITSYGRAVDAVKLSCGAVTNVTSTDYSLRLGNVMYVTVDSQDQFTVLLNPQTGFCIKKTIAIQMKEGGTESKLIDTADNVKLNDENCRRLVVGETTDTTLAKHVVDRLKKPMKHLFSQEILKSYKPNDELLDYNIARDMGILIRNYTNTEGYATIVSLVARGVLVVPVKVAHGIPRRLVLRNDVVYYGKDVAFTKLSAKDGLQTYQVLTRLDESRCRCDQYDVADDGSWEGGRYQKLKTDAAETHVEGNCTDEAGCQDLIQGKNLKTAQALNYGDITDEMGVPKS